ncbi:oxidoreductase [Agrococcus jenensis]|uniref:2,4-dienoyl-CoA reductase-like NADH-dependent reductase (Old Yellow Enzyme family) n=1 Tax=Agrococcus jenensis TaxID=46353 RepID=A0A3N2AUY6_9MICO|nr:oxidoreductase [Agrococcus jenensis]ROR66844.1 2,4-dienoyl-CoA reductase-like NADH-dependent reductase (Old Yellow Enzyme family) [Agrococcus jenensis]
MSAPSITDPIEVRGLRVRNRIWIAPMCQYSVMAYDGVPTAWHRVHYGALASGGTGMLVVEATAIAPEGRITRQDTGLWNDEQRDAWRPIVDFAHQAGAAIGVQLSHAGAKAGTFAGFGRDGDRRGSVPIDEGGWPTVSASDEAILGLAAPRALATSELDGIVAAFVAAAQRAVEAGFDVVEVHGAHGYLLHQFLSPLTNRRVDGYGGDLAGRSRLLLDVVRAIRAELPALPVLVRLSATDWTDGGLDEQQAAQVAAWALEAGADFVDASSGGVVLAEIPVGPGYQVHLAERIAAEGVPVSAVGLIETAEQANAVLRGGVAAVRVGRAALRDPNLPIRWAGELGVDVDWHPQQYRRAY